MTISTATPITSVTTKAPTKTQAAKAEALCAMAATMTGLDRSAISSPRLVKSGKAVVSITSTIAGQLTGLATNFVGAIKIYGFQAVCVDGINKGLKLRLTIGTDVASDEAAQYAVDCTNRGITTFEKYGAQWFAGCQLSHRDLRFTGLEATIHGTVTTTLVIDGVEQVNEMLVVTFTGDSFYLKVSGEDANTMFGNPSNASPILLANRNTVPVAPVVPAVPAVAQAPAATPVDAATPVAPPAGQPRFRDSENPTPAPVEVAAPAAAPVEVAAKGAYTPNLEDF